MDRKNRELRLPFLLAQTLMSALICPSRFVKPSEQGGSQGSRTNDIMRTLTVLTAIFLPLNLITGFFGMNFDGLPLIHKQAGVWWALGAMVVVALALVAVFWRKRYMARSGR